MYWKPLNSKRSLPNLLETKLTASIALAIVNLGGSTGCDVKRSYLSYLCWIHWLWHRSAWAWIAFTSAALSLHLRLGLCSHQRLSLFIFGLDCVHISGAFSYLRLGSRSHQRRSLFIVGLDRVHHQYHYIIIVRLKNKTTCNWDAFAHYLFIFFKIFIYLLYNFL